MTDKEQIWRRIAEMETPGFFITADIMCEGSSELDGLEVFIKGKITQIQQGITGRKFTFQEGEWRLHLTFFPTNCVVDVWGIERSGFFNGREKWAKGFENQRV